MNALEQLEAHLEERSAPSLQRQGSRTLIAAAPSRAELNSRLSEYLTPHEKAGKIECLARRAFRAMPTEDDWGVQYETEVEGQKHIFGPEQPSHAFLEHHFAAKAARVREYIDQRNESD